MISLCSCMAFFERVLLRYCCRFLPFSAAGISPGSFCPVSTGGTPAETFDDPSPRHPHGCHPRGPALFRQLKWSIPSFCSFRRFPETKNSSFRSCQKPTEKVSGIVSQSPTSVNGRPAFCGASAARPLYRASAYCGAPGHRAGRLHCPWPASPARRPAP